MSSAFNFPGLISPDPVEVVRESIISIFYPEASSADSCRLCKKSNKSDPNIKVTPMGLYQSRRLLRGTLQCLQLRGHEQHFEYNTWGGVHWELRLCGECATILKRLSDKYFELEKMRLEFGELRGRTAKEVVVDKLGLPVGMYDKWERELLKPEETMWRKRNTKDVGVGGDGSAVGLKEQVEADFEVKVEESGWNIFEEMEIEPEFPEPLPVVPLPGAEEAVDLDVDDVRVTTILPATASKQKQKQQQTEEECMKTTTRGVCGSSKNISKLTMRSVPFTSGAEKPVDDECLVILPQVPRNDKQLLQTKSSSSSVHNTQVSCAGRSNSTPTTLKTYGRNRNKLVNEPQIVKKSIVAINPTKSVDAPPPLEVLAVCTKGHGHHRKAVNNEVNLPGLRKELVATMLSTRNKPAITYGRKPAAEAFPPQKKSTETEEPKAPWRVTTFLDEMETTRSKSKGPSGLENELSSSSPSSSKQYRLTVSVGLSSSNSRRKQTLSVRTDPSGVNNEEKKEDVKNQTPGEIVFLHNNEDEHLIDLASVKDEDESDESDSDISIPDVDPLATEEDPGSKEKTFLCRYCDHWSEFRSSGNLNNHIRAAHKKEWERIGRRHKFHRCSLCPTPAYYKHTSAFKSHLRTVHKVAGAPHPCPSCPETFDGPIKLLRHREEAHDYQPPPKGSVRNCAICDKKCLSQKALWAHLESEHSVLDDSSLRHPCSHCEESFLDTSLLHLHQVKVHFLKPEGYDQCVYCLRLLSNQKMSDHIRKAHKVHKFANASSDSSGEKTPENISCSVCKSITAEEEDQNKLKFDSVDKLEEHVKSKEHVDLVESLERMNVFCGVCRLSFGNDTAALAEHLRSEEHTREQCEVTKIMICANTGGNLNPSASFCAPCRVFCVTRTGLSQHQKTSVKHLRLVAEFRGAWILNKIPKVPETPKEQFKCPTCLKFFTEKSNFNKHVKQMHKEFYPCEYCEQKFKNRKDLFSHLRVHKDVIPVKAICPHCGKGFPTNGRLSFHIRSYHEGEPSVCKLCGKTFSTPATLKMHIQNFHTHSLSCSHCSMTFKKTTRLRRHSYLKHKEEYTKDAPFVCLLCFHKFPLHEDLDNHSAAHDSTTCTICSKAFYSIAELRNHMKVKHDPEKKRKNNWGNTTCEICGKVSLGRMGAWNHRMWHERKNSPPPFACGECGKKFFVEKWLGWHKKKTGHK